MTGGPWHRGTLSQLFWYPVRSIQMKMISPRDYLISMVTSKENPYYAIGYFS